MPGVAENHLPGPSVEETREKGYEGHGLVAVAEFPVQTGQQTGGAALAVARFRPDELLRDGHVHGCRHPLAGHIPDHNEETIRADREEIVQVAAYLLGRFHHRVNFLFRMGSPGRLRFGNHAHLDFPGDGQFAVDSVFGGLGAPLAGKIVEHENKDGDPDAIGNNHREQRRADQRNDLCTGAGDGQRHPDVENLHHGHQQHRFPDPDFPAPFDPEEKPAEKAGQDRGQRAGKGRHPAQGVAVNPADEAGERPDERPRQQAGHSGPEIPEIGDAAKNLDARDRPIDGKDTENQGQKHAVLHGKIAVQHIAEERNPRQQIGENHEHGQVPDQRNDQFDDLFSHARSPCRGSAPFRR